MFTNTFAEYNVNHITTNQMKYTKPFPKDWAGAPLMPLPDSSQATPNFMGGGDAESLPLYSHLGDHCLRNHGCK